MIRDMGRSIAQALASSNTIDPVPAPMNAPARHLSKLIRDKLDRAGTGQLAISITRNEALNIYAALTAQEATP